MWMLWAIKWMQSSHSGPCGSISIFLPSTRVQGAPTWFQSQLSGHWFYPEACWSNFLLWPVLALLPPPQENCLSNFLYILSVLYKYQLCLGGEEWALFPYLRGGSKENHLFTADALELNSRVVKLANCQRSQPVGIPSKRALWIMRPDPKTCEPTFRFLFTPVDFGSDFVHSFNQCA